MDAVINALSGELPFFVTESLAFQFQCDDEVEKDRTESVFKRRLATTTWIRNMVVIAIKRSGLLLYPRPECGSTEYVTCTRIGDTISFFYCCLSHLWGS